MKPIFLSLGLLAATATHAGAAGMPRSTVTIDTARGPVHFTVEVAADEASRAEGMMHRRHLAENAGMLFDFHANLFAAFWMKHTPLSLDMIFIRPDGRISSIARDMVPFSEKEVASKEPIRAVLEINGGRSAALGIVPGDMVHADALGNAISPISTQRRNQSLCRQKKGGPGDCPARPE